MWLYEKGGGIDLQGFYWSAPTTVPGAFLLDKTDDITRKWMDRMDGGMEGGGEWLWGRRP